MADEDLPTPQAPAVESCYRHPGIETGVHCTRCGKPICPDCMIPAPVGYQCPDCVEEARNEFRRSGSGPQQVRSMSGTPVTTGIIIILIAVYAVQLLTRGRLTELGSGSPYLITNGAWWRLITPVFLHADVLPFGIMHIAFNCYGVYLFGGFVERTFGRVPLIVIFLVTGFVGNAASFVFVSLDTPRVFVGGVGASGAVFGLAGVFCAFNYRRRNTQLGRALLRQMVTWLALNAVFALAVPIIDWRAHLGGLVAGFLTGFAVEELGEKIPKPAALALVSVAIVAIATLAVFARAPAIQQAALDQFSALT